MPKKTQLSAAAIVGSDSLEVTAANAINVRFAIEDACLSGNVQELRTLQRSYIRVASATAGAALALFRRIEELQS